MITFSQDTNLAGNQLGATLTKAKVDALFSWSQVRRMARYIIVAAGSRGLGKWYRSANGCISFRVDLHGTLLSLH